MEHKKLYITLLIIFIIVLCIGGTFALVATSNAINITQIKAGNLTMTISGGTSENVSFVPSECTGDSAIKKTIVAKATNTSGGKVSFSVGLDITALSDTYKKDTIRYALSTNADSCAVGIITGGDFKDKSVGDEVWLIKNDYDDITRSGNTYTKTYYLYIWLDKSETEHFDGNISVKLKGSTSNNPNLPVADDYNDGNGTNTLFYQIKSTADKYTRIDFSKTSEASSTNGIYVTTNTYNGVPVYYYRGNVDNHVLFANFCWQIIRTTETGGVKLIYDGVPSNGQCSNTGSNSTIGDSAFNSTYNDAKYVGYMYGSSIDDTANITDSTIKEVIDTWYKSNMASYTSQLEDTVFCNDRSYYIDDEYGMGSEVHKRLIINKTPTLKCQNTKDKFTVSASNGNGALTYPVGLITADEITYAGGVSGLSNKNNQFYLYTSEWYWTMSPQALCDEDGFANEYVLRYSGNLDSKVIDHAYGVRPVLALKPETEISSGSGTSTDPFIVK